MDALVQELDIKLRQWQPDIVEQVRQCLAEIIELADQDRDTEICPSKMQFCA